MKTTVMKIFLALVALFFFASSYATATETAKPAAEVAQSSKAVDLRLALRTLWDGHIFWIRNVVVATHAGDTKAAKIADAQVVKNAKDIGDAIAGFYGKEAGEKLFKLLAGHYASVKRYMNADYKGDKGDKDGAHAATDAGIKNASDIAVFLSSANPFLPKDTLVSLLTAHYGHHVNQIDEVKANDWAGESENWEAMLKHIDGISDALSAALVKQFPKKF